MRRAIIIIILLAMMPLAVESQHYGFYRGSRVARNDLGVSSEMSINPGGRTVWKPSGGGFSSVSPNVTFGRTGGLVSTTADRQLTSFSSSLPELATTTNSGNMDADSNPQGFMETPTYTVTQPIGDAIIPLLLLLLPVVIWKLRK